MNGFTEVSQNEMMEVDAGGWIAFICTGAVAVAGFLSGGIVGTCVGTAAGYYVGTTLENALAYQP